MKVLTNKRAGISLVALIVTIIVLIILTAAVIVTFMEDGIVDKAKKATFRSDIRNYQDILLEKSSVRKIDRETGTGLEEGYQEITKTGKDEIKTVIPEFKDEYDGVVDIENGKLVLGANVLPEHPEGKYARYKEWLLELGIEAPTGSSSEENNIEVISGEQWTLTGDNDEDGKVSEGDLLTPIVPGLSNEKFYVIADDVTTLTLLAEYYIDTSTNTQSANGYSKVVFNEDEWGGESPTEFVTYANSSIREVVKDYVDTLTGLDLEDVEEVYGGPAITGQKGRLMWYEEVQELKTTYSDIIFGQWAPEEGYYWIGENSEYTSQPYITDYVYFVGNGIVEAAPCWVTDMGVRPVIKILKSNF